MDDEVEVGRRDAGLGHHRLDAVEDRLFRRAVGGQHLGRIQLAPAIQRDVGEGAADIGAEADALPVAHAGSFAASAASRIWVSVWRGVSASGEMLRSSTAPVREARARAKAAGNSSVLFTRSPW